MKFKCEFCGRILDDNKVGKSVLPHPDDLEFYICGNCLNEICNEAWDNAVKSVFGFV